MQNERLEAQYEYGNAAGFNQHDLTPWMEHVNWLLKPPEGQTIEEAARGLVQAMYVDGFENRGPVEEVPADLVNGDYGMADE